jgi:hypothetical protein
MFKPRTYEFFQNWGILEEVQKIDTQIPTFRAYKLPGGTEVAKQWDLYPSRKAWPDRPFVCLVVTMPVFIF